MDATDAPARTRITVRPATEADGAELEVLVARAFDRFEQLLFSTTGHCEVAVDDTGRLLGGTVLRTIDVEGLRVGVVDWVFADPAAGVPGVGSALRDAAHDWFQDQGCHEQVARIEPVNTASQELHRRGGYVPLPFRSQVRRWGWRLPQLWLRAHAGFDPGLRLWVRSDPSATPSLGSRWAGTVLLNTLLLVLVAWRAPRDVTLGLAGVAWMGAIVVLLLGAREATLRLIARSHGLRLGHVPWVSGTGVGLALALLAGVWFPLTGSSVPDHAPWRYSRARPGLAHAHLAAGIAVLAVGWSAALVPAAPAWLPLADIQRAATMLALIELVVPVSPFLGRSARIVRDHSTRAWLSLATGALALGAWTAFGP
jgi:RimJ/RimL family protein N-acetyltransferase